MTSTNETLGRTLLKGLVDLREQKGQITLSDVGILFTTMSREYTSSDAALYQEIKRLASYIDEANREIFAIATNEKSEAALLDASAHLEAVVKDTETASNSIMDAADIIQQSVGGVGGDKEQKIMEATNKIYDACNFQDIAGQRITKVVRLLANIEQRISKLISLLGTSGSGNIAPESGKVIPMHALSDKDLLNGPQLPGQATSQEEIDQLFASLTAKK